jgi:hypothetical protein
MEVDEELNVEPIDISAAVYRNDDSSEESGDKEDESEAQGDKICGEEECNDPVDQFKELSVAHCGNIGIKSRTA